MIQPGNPQRFWTLPTAAAIGFPILFSVQPASSYSVLTREAIIDSTWDASIRPLLLKRFRLQEELGRMGAVNRDLAAANGSRLP